MLELHTSFRYVEIHHQSRRGSQEDQRAAGRPESKQEGIKVEDEDQAIVRHCQCSLIVGPHRKMSGCQ